MVFGNENVYKVLKKIFTYAFPALMFVWENIYVIWNIPYGAQINTTIFVLWGGLGIFLGISKYKYNNALEGYLGDSEGGDENEIGVG